MKKYLLIPVLMLSFNAFAEVKKEDVIAMMQEVKSMTKEEVSAKHIALYGELKADVTQETCKTLDVFDRAARQTKKISLLDMKALDRTNDARRTCRNNGFSYGV
ncbi:TPA: hypothetical protein ACX6RM_002319 [Photobacterium damselae]